MTDRPTSGAVGLFRIVGGSLMVSSAASSCAVAEHNDPRVAAHEPESNFSLQLPLGQY